MNRIKLLASTLLFWLSLPGLMAQNSAIDRYFETYREDARFSRVTVSSKMFSLFLELEGDDPDEQAIIETISKLDGLKMLVGQEVDEAKSIFGNMLKQPKANMDELMTISDVDKEIQFFVTESGGKISELVMVGYEVDKVMILSLIGDIDLKEISRLSKKMNLDGFEHLKDINKQ